MSSESTGKIVLEPPDMDAAVTMHIVLVHPEIPQNSGNIARLCAGMNAWLHLVEPLGYELSNAKLKRAGLDYWPSVRLSVHRDLASLEMLLRPERTWLFSAKATCGLGEASMGYGDVLVFGRESAGLPVEFVDRWQDRTVKIPTTSKIRSHNLANSVAIAGYHLLMGAGWNGEET
jgi:tRNA (cytidine/uridine-2'-O-)-methyltransferase